MIRIFLLFAAVYLLFIGLYHTMAPARYQATARIKIEQSGSGYDSGLIQEQLKMLQSQDIRTKVMEILGRPESDWGKHSTLARLHVIPGFVGELELRQISNTRLIEIKVGATNPQDAAAIANTIADVYRQHQLANTAETTRTVSVQVVEPAVPPRRPSFPNRYLGGFSLLLGGVCGVLGFPFNRRRQGNALQPGAAS